MVKKGPKQIPESLRKLQVRIQHSNAQRVKAHQDKELQVQSLSVEAGAKAEQYLTEYLKGNEQKENNLAQAKKTSSFWVESEAKVLLVVRIKGINKIAPKPRKVLKLFRLLQLHNAVLIKNNKATQNMLRLIEPFVTYGYPSAETISRLVYKRGFLKVNGQRIPINDNLQIQTALGCKGITTAEDLIHELVNCGPYFRECNNLLWTFKLTSPLKGFVHKRTSFIQGGDWGDREVKINSLLIEMNFTMVFYFIPQDSENIQDLNAFGIQKDIGQITQGDIRNLFPLPGIYHFRFRNYIDGKIAWMDLNADECKALVWQGKIIMKVTRVGWGCDIDNELIL